MLCVYDVEKRSTVLENVAGFARLDTYVYSSITKWQHCGMLIHWGNKLLRSPECCMIQNTTCAEFLEVQIPPRILEYDWDP